MSASRLAKLNLGKRSRRMKPLDPKIKKILQDYSSKFDDALKKGEECLQDKDIRFGGCPFPWDTCR